MALLTNADVRSILNFLQVLLTPCTVETFSEQVFSALPSVIPSEFTGLTLTSFQSRTLLEGWNSDNSNPEYIQVANQHFSEHPYAQYYFQTRDGKAHSISDFITEAEFHRLEGLYHRYLRPLGLEDQMVTILPSLSPSPKGAIAQKPDETLVLALHRSERNFTERDRLVLNLLRPHLAQAFQNAQTLTQTQQSLTQLNQTLEQLGTIAVSMDGQVRRISNRACELLNHYFDPVSLPSQALPDSLQRWLNHQIGLMAQAERLAMPCPLKVEQQERQLTIRLLVDRPGEQYLLLLEEEQIAVLSAAALELLGLTKREAEVLFWVTQDKSDGEIASVLNLSTGTVKKHLEHIYQKFNVHTRTAAAMYALRNLGLL